MHTNTHALLQKTHTMYHTKTSNGFLKSLTLFSIDAIFIITAFKSAQYHSLSEENESVMNQLVLNMYMRDANRPE